MLLIDDQNFGSQANLIPVNDKPSLIINSYHMDEWNWIIGGSSATASAPQPVSAEFRELNSPLIDGLDPVINPTFQPYYKCCETGNSIGLPLYYLDKAKRATSIRVTASTMGDPLDSVLSAVNPGTALKNGKVANAKGVYYGATEVEFWSDSSIIIFENSLRWLLDDIDSDGDGYVLAEDCDDSNPSIYQNLQGYTDNDEDLYGIGSQIMVCSGEDLPEKYSDIGGDCNDNNPDINPDAEEIEYDGIDQDCKDGDLRDVDEDGYDSEIVGGLDCDDEDPEINPDNPDKTMNCVNDSPVYNGNFTEIRWDEDTTTIVNIKNFFSDPDGDELEFGVFDTSNNQEIEVIFQNNSVLFISEDDWYGSDWIIFEASDGNLSAQTNNITLIVRPVNDDPELDFIDDITVIEGGLVKVSPTSSDIENDTLIFSFGSPLDSNGEWQTEDGDSGVYIAKINVSDGNGGKDSQDVEIHVIDKMYINEIGSNWVEIYNPGTINVSLNGFVLDNNNLSGKINANGFYVVENLSLTSYVSLYLGDEVMDEVDYSNFTLSSGQSLGREYDGNANFIIFDYPTKGVSNTADVTKPVVNLIWPNNEVFNTRDVELIFNASDEKASQLICNFEAGVVGSNKVKYSNITVDSGIEKEFTIQGLSDGIYSWNVECFDGTNKAKADSDFLFIISAPDAPNFNDMVNFFSISENKTLIFNVSASDPDGSNLTYSAQNLPLGSLFDNQTFSWTPDFTQAGNYLITFVVEDESELIDTMQVEIRVKDVRLPPEFNDAETCDVIDENIKISIKDPDENDEFSIDNIIEMSIEIENNADEDADLEVIAYLYDLDNDEVIEEYNDDVDIDKNDDAEVDMSIKVPRDIDENNDYALYVYAGEDKDKFCNSEYIEIKLERADNLVLIDQFVIDPDVTGAGDEVFVSIRVKNIGNDGQDDVYVKLISNELNVSLESERFDLDDYDGDDDSKTLSFKFIVPQDTLDKDYLLNAQVIYNGGESKESRTLSISDQLTVTRSYTKPGEPIDIDSILLEREKQETERKKLEINMPLPEVKVGNDYIYIFIIMSLMFGLGIVLLLVTIFMKTKWNADKIDESE